MSITKVGISSKNVQIIFSIANFDDVKSTQEKSFLFCPQLHKKKGYLKHAAY